MRIRNNLVALFVQRLYNVQNNCMGRTARRISSGARINSSADDAAGLAISENVRARIRGLMAASRNSGDAASLAQTAEGTMASMQAALQRMRELAVQSASDINEDIDREALDAEYQHLLKELQDISEEADFNGKLLLAGRPDHDPSVFLIQVGPDTGDTFSLIIGNVTPDSLSLSGTHIRTGDAAADALSGLDSAIGRVSGERANLGAVQMRLEHKMKSLDALADNLSEADSRIRDADVAEEMMKYTQARMLSHISAAILSQANALAGNVLFLLAKQTMTSPASSTADEDIGASGSFLISAGAEEKEMNKASWQQEESGGTLENIGTFGNM